MIAERAIALRLLRAATGGDNPDYVNGGYLFDADFYFERFSLARPDVVILEPGENDSLKQTLKQVPVSVEKGLRTMLPQLRAALPGARIGVTMSGQARGVQGEADWIKKAVALRTAIGVVRDLADPLVYVIPAWAHQTPYEGFSITSTGAVTDANTGVITADISDPVHPIDTARDQLAQSITAFIAWAA